MAYAAQHTDFAPCVGARPAGRSHAAAPRLSQEEPGKTAGVLRRLLDAILASRQKRADREIAGFIARRGGRITDELEREMTQRLLTSSWSIRG